MLIMRVGECFECVVQLTDNWLLVSVQRKPEAVR
jgi:hypothetical protein